MTDRIARRKRAVVIPSALVMALGAQVGAIGGVVPAGADPVSSTIPCQQILWHNDRCPDWTTVYDHPFGTGDSVGTDRPVASAMNAAGTRLFVTGTSTDSQTGRDIVTLAIDTAAGSRVWVKRYDSPAEGGEAPNDIAISPDGSRVFVTGYEDDGLESSGQPSRDGRAVTLAYDAAAGTLLWKSNYDGDGGLSDVGESIAVSPDGSEVYVSATAFGEGGSPVGVTSAYGADSGELLWRALRPSPSGDNGRSDRSALVVSPDGERLYVAAVEFPQENALQRDFVVIAYGTSGAEAGRELWATHRDGGAADEVRGVDIAPDGQTVFVAGASGSSWVAFAMSSNGGGRWLSTLPGTTNASPRDLDVSPTGDRVVVTGGGFASLADPRDSYAAITVAYEPGTGEPIWTAKFNPEGPIHDEGIDVEISAEGDVFVAGHSELDGGGGGGGDLAFREERSTIVALAYDRDGAPLWVARLDDAPVSPVADAATAQLRGDRLYVTGALGRPAAWGAQAATANYTDLLVAAYSTGLGATNNVTCDVEPFNPSDGTIGLGYGQPQARADALFVRASDRGMFEVNCTTQAGPSFVATARYNFEFSRQAGVWEDISPGFACSASAVPVLNGGTHTAPISVPGTPGCAYAEVFFAENDPRLGLPHRFCIEVLDVSGCSASWTHEKVNPSQVGR
ncbi:MAG: PQQ-binding-like beta-propeller repeat protein [Actinomycetota bacterium]